MGTFLITGPDGKRYKVTGDTPEGALAALKKMAPEAPDYRGEGVGAGSGLEAALIGARQGVTFGFGDEINAGVRALGDRILRGTPLSEAYETRLEHERGLLDQTRRENPVLASVGEVGGAILPSLMLPGGGAASISNMMKSAGLGAAAGGVYGFGDGQGGFESRMGSAAMGGAMGGVLGAAVPLVASGVSKAAKSLASRPDAAATRAMGLSPTSVEAVMNAMQADDALTGAGRARINSAGPGAMLADAGGSAEALLDTSIQKGGAGARMAREAIEGRATNANRELSEALSQRVARLGQSAGTDVIPYGDMMSPTGRLYQRAYSAPVDYATDAGRRIEELLPRVPKSVIDRANQLISMDPDAINPAQIMASIGDDGAVTFSKQPNVLQLDYITRALNDVARAGDGQGALGGATNEGRIYGKLSRLIRRNLRDAVPEYGVAVDQAATEIAAKQAREYASVVLRPGTTRAEVAEEVASMSRAELRHLREGLRQSIDDTLANVTRVASDGNVEAREATKALRDLSSRAAREKMAAIIGDEQAAALGSQMDEAARALELRSATATNSKTFGRMETDRIVRDRLFGGPVETLARGEGVGAARRVAQAITGRTPAGNAAREQQVYSEIARLLTEKRGADAALTIEQLERLAATRPITEALARKIGTRTAAAGATAGFVGLENQTRH